MMDAALVGTGGMTPAPNRFLSSLLCRYEGRMLLIDCGEGSQVSMKLLGWGYKNIDAICFTHYHADHISGLPGLMLAISNSGRTEDVTLIGPPELERIVTGLLVIAPELSYGVQLMELPYTEHKKIPVPGTELFLSALPVMHGKPCFAYNVETQRRGKFDLNRAESLGIPKRLWARLQSGEDVIHEGLEYTPDMVLGSPRKGFKISYCTDTRPTKRIPGFIKNADLFVCEGMYGDPEKLSLAKSHMHMVYSEAASLAREGGVKKLWLTHYSPAMVNPREHIGVARAVFAESYAGHDRMTCSLTFDNQD